MVSAISAVLAFMPPPPFTATNHSLGASQGAEYLLLMNAAADGSASPDRCPAISCYNVMHSAGPHGASLTSPLKSRGYARCNSGCSPRRSHPLATKTSEAGSQSRNQSHAEIRAVQFQK